MLLLIAQGRELPEKFTFANRRAGRAKMLALLQAKSAAAGGAPVIFAYEASGQGFGLYDELTAAGIACHVLAPTRMARSPKQQRNKTDEKDALAILQLLRGHVLAGNPLPTVWVPEPQLRDDRELVRTRLDVADKISAVKTQVRCLLKRNGWERPEGVASGWSCGFVRWLDDLTEDAARGAGAREALSSLLRQWRSLMEEESRLDKRAAGLARLPRYREQVQELCELPGVGRLTAMVFLTEVGDLARFANRRQLGAYLGLVPTACESGEQNDRKRHITRQGPSRVRRVLCQATWANLRSKESTQRKAYDRIVAKNPKHKKIAVVAVMRRMGVRMWHVARDVGAAMAGRPAESSLGPWPRSGLPWVPADGRSPDGKRRKERPGRHGSARAGDLPPTSPPLGPQRSFRRTARQKNSRATAKNV
jgi:transposase